jgi:hypothetical protein
VAPIHFPSHPCPLPLPWGLYMHTHVLPLLAGRPFPLSFLIVFLLIAFLLTCIISACQISGSPPMPFPLYRYPSYYILSPIAYYQSMTLSPLTLTTSPVSDSVPHYPYHSLGLWLNHPSALTLPLVSDSFLFTYCFLYYCLQPGPCLSPTPI